jgi:predicted transcriptional regulator
MKASFINMAVIPYNYGDINMRYKDALIVRFLIEHKNDELSILQIAKGVGMDYKNIHTIIKRLEKASLIKVERFGQSSRIRLISQVHPLIFEAEYARRNERLNDRNLAVMRSDFMKAVKSSCLIMLLFGSYAKRTQTKKSDIDVLLIVPDRREEIIEKSIGQAAGSLPLPIHCLVFSETQFLEMIHAAQPNVGHEALQNNIILYGIEAYYQMIAHG